MGATILPTTTRPEIEIDEHWSYVGSKGEIVWQWAAVEWGTKRMVGWAVGDRSALMRKTLSFSRDVQLHAVRIRMVVDAYNAERAGIWQYQQLFAPQGKFCHG
jgi:IS1 family transposase